VADYGRDLLQGRPFVINDTPLLSEQQLADYKEYGVLSPLSFLTPDEASSARDVFLALQAMCGTKPGANVTSQCHLHFPQIYALVCDARLLDRVAQIIGENILVHSTTLFHKHAGDAQFVSWHQDAYYWGLSEPQLVSVWIALSPSTAENGCMQVIRATHKEGILPHGEKSNDEKNLLRSGLSLKAAPVLDDVQDVILQPGEFSLHHPFAIHGSSPNRSTTPRMGFAIRYVSASVQQSSLHHEVVSVRGVPAEHYKTVLPPVNSDREFCLQAQLNFAERLAKQRRTQNRADSEGVMHSVKSN